MLQDSFHQKQTVSAREHQMDLKTILWSFVQTPGKTALVFLLTLIYGYKWLLPQVVWLGLRRDMMLFCMMDKACSQLLLCSCTSVLEQDTEALR